MQNVVNKMVVQVNVMGEDRKIDAFNLVSGLQIRSVFLFLSTGTLFFTKSYV